MSNDNLAALRKAAEPLIKYLNNNHHPHMTVIVISTSIKLLEDTINIPRIDDFVKD